VSAEFFSPEGLAEYLDLPSVRTVYAWRAKGTGPRGHSVGKHVRFRRSDVEAWLDNNSDPAPKGRRR